MTEPCFYGISPNNPREVRYESQISAPNKESLTRLKNWKTEKNENRHYGLTVARVGIFDFATNGC